MAKSFDELGKRGQVSRLKSTALDLLAQYPVDIRELKLINHGFNTTFAVSASDGSKYALRINTNSLRDEAEMNAEVAWVSALSAETDLRVPTPQTTKGGAQIAEAWSEPLNRKARGVLYSWLPGKNAGIPLAPATAEAMGRATRTMHEHAAGFQMPAGAGLKPIKDVMFGYEYQIDRHMPDLDHSLFHKVVNEGNRLVKKLNSAALIPIHYDLHMWNVKWMRGKLSVFDFDDTILGTPVMDAYVTLFYIRISPNAEEIEEAYWRGLGSAPAELGVTPEEFEWLVASRAPLLVNEFYKNNTAGFSELAPKYAKVTETRLKHFSDTGRFDPRVATMQG
ncbi:MAG: phosphotransferase [Fimbriimonadaceae bacterium]|nr:phosphotransferase [Fimbriimonadaceae bacterium]